MIKSRILLILVLMASHSTGVAGPYQEDFNIDDGEWTPIDFMANENHWQHATWNDPAGGIKGVAWVGTDDAQFAAPPGYGNDWHQYLTKHFSLPAGPSLVSFGIQYDTELSFDFCLIEVSTNGVDYSPLAVFDGSSAGIEEHDVDLTGYAGQDVDLRFRFSSDAAWSDEDGLIDTDGACRLDWVEVTGHARDSFDSGLDGWVASAYPGLGSFRLEQEPCGMPPDNVEIECRDWPYENTWVAYQADTREFPNTSPDEWQSGLEVKLGIESPVIPITVVEKLTLEFDVYDNNPLQDGVVFAARVAAPPPSEGGSYRSTFYQFRTEGTGSHRCFDITPLIDPGAQNIQIQLVAVTLNALLAPILSGNHTAAPWFDNVCLASDDDECELPIDLLSIGCDDEDGDLVPDRIDDCPETHLPDGGHVAVSELGNNRWSLLNDNLTWTFTQASPQSGANHNWTIVDTRGCSCEQIVEAANLGQSHLRKGCSTSAVLDWIENP